MAAVVVAEASDVIWQVAQRQRLSSRPAAAAATTTEILNVIYIIIKKKYITVKFAKKKSYCRCLSKYICLTRLYKQHTILKLKLIS